MNGWVSPLKPRGGGKILERLLVSDVVNTSSSITYSVKLEDPVVVAAMYLASMDTEAVAVSSSEGRVHGVLTGYNLIALINKDPENVWKALYKTQSYDIDWRILTGTMTESLESILSRMLKRLWGYAVIRKEGDEHSIIGVLDVAKLLLKSVALEEAPEIRISEIATKPIISVSKESTIRELIRVMLRHRIRRVYVEEEDKIINDRYIISYLLSSPIVDNLRDDPKGVLMKPVTDMVGYMRRPAWLDPETGLTEALKQLLNNEVYTIITEDKRYIMTPWDIVMGFYKRQRPPKSEPTIL